MKIEKPQVPSTGLQLIALRVTKMALLILPETVYTNKTNYK